MLIIVMLPWDGLGPLTLRLGWVGTSNISACTPDSLEVSLDLCLREK
jgi:hypothetical protein